MKTLELTFPNTTDPKQAVAALRSIITSAGRGLVCFETWATGRGISHLISTPNTASLAPALSSALPGIRIEETRRPVARLAGSPAGVVIRGPGAGVVRTDISAEASASVLAALGRLASHETVVVQWLVVRLRRGRWEHGPVGVERIAKAKRSETEVVAAGRIGVWTKHRRRSGVVASRIGGTYQQLAGVDGRLSSRRSRAAARRIVAMGPPLLVWPSHLNVDELSGVVGWPLSPVPIPGVIRAAARLLPASRALPTRGPSVGEATYPGSERPINLGTEGRQRHLHVIGPTGVGKTTLLTRLIAADVAAGRGVVVLDPIGDLTDAVAERIPPGRRDDLVVVDPTDSELPVGLNLLAGDKSTQLVEFTVGVFSRLFASSWGPRSADVLRASLLTLTSRSGSTLADLPDLLTNPAFRRKVVPAVMHDRLLAGFWGWFEALSEAERSNVIAPVLNKTRALLLRPEVVRVLCHPDGALNLTEVFTRRRIVVIRLAKGIVGQETAQLIGGLLMARLWQAILARTAVDPSRRHSAFVYLDEFQDYLRLPMAVGDMLAQARGLSVGLVVAHQHLHQLPDGVRRDVLANVGSRVMFQTRADDARVLARDLAPHLTAADLEGLGRREIVASIALRDRVLPPVTGRTLPLAPAITSAAEQRGRSAELYGRRLPKADNGANPGLQIGQRRRGGSQ